MMLSQLPVVESPFSIRTFVWDGSHTFLNSNTDVSHADHSSSTTLDEQGYLNS